VWRTSAATETRFAVQLHGSFPMAAYPDLAKAVERYPFAELTVHDVVWWRPLWPVLTLAAAATERVLVGPDVTHPLLCHPIVTAAGVAALDELTGGRAVLGVGRGSLLEPLGIRPAAPGQVRELATSVQRYLEAGFRWRPPRRRVPVFVGTFGPAMIEAACTGWAEEVRPPGIWNPGYLGEVQRQVKGRVRVGCEVWTVVDRDRERAREMAREVLAAFLPAMGTMTRFFGVDPRAPISDATLDLFCAAGTPADVASGLERLLEAGPATVTFSGRLGPDPLWAIERLGEIVSVLSH
jgi:5,10-methylenetetrahydromethanopterin reductase